LHFPASHYQGPYDHYQEDDPAHAHCHEDGLACGIYTVQRRGGGLEALILIDG
jgi:hypothetical protein